MPNPRRLTLTRESIRRLTDQQLDHIGGISGGGTCQPRQCAVALSYDCVTWYGQTCVLTNGVTCAC
jgi:hypothetical protein